MNQADKKRNLKSNGAAATKPVRNQGKPPHGDKTAVSNREHSRDERDGKAPQDVQGVYKNARFVHACAALVGHVVQVRLQGDSEIYVGVFNTISPNLEIVLRSVHAISKNATTTSALASQAPDHLASLLYEMDRIRAKPLQDTFIFSLRDVVSMTASNIDLDYATKDPVFLDSQISGANGHAQERDLQKWVADDDEAKEFGMLEKSAGISSWNPEAMFEVNAKKFAVKSTFKQNLEGYTYQIEQEDTEEFHEREVMATKLAQEIENNPLNKRRVDLEVAGDNEDEERKFSAVGKERHNHAPINRRNNKSMPANGLKGQQRMGHSQRGAHDRSPPVQPAPQQQATKRDDRERKGERSPATRVTSSPKPNEKRESPVPVTHSSPPQTVQQSPPPNRRSPDVRKKTPSPPIQEEPKGKQSPRESASPAPPKPATQPEESTTDIVKNSKLNPNAKEFVFSPKIEATHKNQPMLPQMQQFPQRGQHIVPQNGLMAAPNIHGTQGYVMPASPHAYQNAGHHSMHAGNPHQRSYRPPKGNRQSEAMQVAGSPLIAGPPPSSNVLVQYQPSSPPFVQNGTGVAANVMIPVNSLMQPRVISPPGPTNVFQQMFIDPALQFGQGSQMIFRPADFQPHMIQTFDPANVYLVSPQQATNQSGTPAPSVGGSAPHGHPNQQPIQYAGQQWAQPIMMMNPMGGPGTPPPHHQMHHLNMMPPAVHPNHQVHNGAHGHGPPTHGYHYGPSVVPTPGAAIQVQAPGGGVPSPSGANPNATPLGQPPTPGAQPPTQMPPVQPGQQQPPQTQQP